MGLFNKGKQKGEQDVTGVSLFDDDNLVGFDEKDQGMNDDTGIPDDLLEDNAETSNDTSSSDITESEDEAELSFDDDELSNAEGYSESDNDDYEDTSEDDNNEYEEESDEDSDEYEEGRIVESDPNSYVLYMIVDKPIDGMLQYFRNYGLNVSRIFSSIKEARDVVLMQVIKSKMVVIDTGTGRFTSMASRNELTDLLGIGDDDNSTIVFYSDSVIKTEVEYSKELENKQVNWVKYKSTAQVLAYLLKNKGKEEYVPDGEYTKAAEIVEDLRHRGFGVQDALERVNIGEVQINTSDIINKQAGKNSEYNEIPGYVIEV